MSVPLPAFPFFFLPPLPALPLLLPALWWCGGGELCCVVGCGGGVDVRVHDPLTNRGAQTLPFSRPTSHRLASKPMRMNQAAEDDSPLHRSRRLARARRRPGATGLVDRDRRRHRGGGSGRLLHLRLALGGLLAAGAGGGGAVRLHVPASLVLAACVGWMVQRPAGLLCACVWVGSLWGYDDKQALVARVLAAAAKSGTTCLAECRQASCECTAADARQAERVEWIPSNQMMPRGKAARTAGWEWHPAASSKSIDRSEGGAASSSLMERAIKSRLHLECVPTTNSIDKTQA